MVKPAIAKPSDRPAATAARPVAGVAFFDLDGTLVDGQTTLLLVKFLRKVGVVSRAYLVGTGLWFVGYKLRLLKVNERTRNRVSVVFEGRSEAEVERLVERFTEEELVPRFNPAATAALSEHRAEGDRVVLISAAMEPVVKAVCRRLGVMDFVGTVCEVHEGRYTGRMVGASPHADEKERIAEAYMRRWGVDAAECWAYADHGSDLALLRSVGHPVAVNPKPELLAEARRAGWPILP